MDHEDDSLNPHDQVLEKFQEHMEMVEDSLECANECLDGLAFLAFKHLKSEDSNAAHLAQELLDSCEALKIKGELVEKVLSAYSSFESYLMSMPGVVTSAGATKTVKWSGAVKLVQEDPGNVYSVFLDDVFVCTLKENSPALSALAAELKIDFDADEQEIVRKWAGPIEFKQQGDTPLFDLYLGNIFLCKLTSNSPQGKDLEEMLLINLVELVDPKFKRSDDEWRVYPTEQEKKEREAKKAAKTKQVASADHFVAIDTKVSLDEIANLSSLPQDVQKAIKSAGSINASGFQEILGYDGRTLLWSAGGHWDGDKGAGKFHVQNFGSKGGIQWPGKDKAKAAIANPANEQLLSAIDSMVEGGALAQVTGINDKMLLSQINTAFGNFVYSLKTSPRTITAAWNLWMDHLGVEHSYGRTDGKALCEVLFGSEEAKGGSFWSNASDYVGATPKRWEEAVKPAKQVPSGGFHGRQGKYYVKDWAGNEIRELGTYDHFDDAWGAISEYLEKQGLSDDEIEKALQEYAVEKTWVGKIMDKEVISNVKADASKPDIDAVVNNLLGDKVFLATLPRVIDVAEAAVTVALMGGNKKAVEFNRMCIDLFHALQKGDFAQSKKLVSDLVMAGHGEAFGL